jgi:hypothetical protein
MLTGLIIASILALFFFIKGLRLAIKLNELREFVLVQEAKMDANLDPVKEDFLKFVSDSREWAFEYIEEVQLALIDFKSKVASEIEHFDKFGDTLSIQRPDYESMKKISKAYKELIIVLPEEKSV